MSEQSQGPGWWLASDGRWYPPSARPAAPLGNESGWVAPDELSRPAEPTWNPTSQWAYGDPRRPVGPPFPPAPPKNQGVRWAVIGPLLALVVVGIVAAVALVGRNNDHGSKSATSSGVAPSTGQVISAHNGTVSLTLPAGWRGADISTGVTGVGAKLVPDDPSAAALLEQRLSVLPRAVVLFGAQPPAPGSAPRFVDNVNVLADPTAPASLTLEEVGPAEARGIGKFATVTDQGVVDLGGRSAYRVTYKSSGFSGVSFIIKGTQDTWVLTYSFGSATADVDLAEASAQTFNAP